jgi:hypothetical protein
MNLFLLFAFLHDHSFELSPCFLLQLASSVFVDTAFASVTVSEVSVVVSSSTSNTNPYVFLRSSSCLTTTEIAVFALSSIVTVVLSEISYIKLCGAKHAFHLE